MVFLLVYKQHGFMVCFKVTHIASISVTDFLVKALFMTSSGRALVKCTVAKGTFKRLKMKMMIHMNAQSLILTSGPRAEMTVY